MKENYKGFTLLELLVVISIIGILAALMLANLASTRERARDATRQSDIKQYQTALGQYASDHTGLYPIKNVIAICADSNFYGTDLGLPRCIDDPQAPSDATQRYWYVSNSTEYAVWARLENAPTNTFWVLCSNGLVDETTTQPNATNICPF